MAEKTAIVPVDANLLTEALNYTLSKASQDYMKAKAVGDTTKQIFFAGGAAMITSILACVPELITGTEVLQANSSETQGDEENAGTTQQ